MVEDDDSFDAKPLPEVRPPSRRRFWLWVAVLTFCAALGFGKPVYDLHWRNRQALFNRDWTRDQADRRQVSTILWRLQWITGEAPHRVEAALGMPTGEVGRQVPATGRHQLDVDGSRLWSEAAAAQRVGFPDAAGWRISLSFRDGSFVAAKASPPPMLSPPSPVVRDALALLCRVTLFASPLVWLGGLLAGVAERNRRGSRFAEAALAGALAGTVAFAVSVPAPLSVRGVVGLVLGVVLMLVALRVARWLRRIERSRQFHFCYDCGYDLTGNQSGVCPECGRETFDGQLNQRAARAAAQAESLAQTVVDDDVPRAENEEDVVPASSVMKTG